MALPKYTNGYEVKYQASDDLYHCLHNGEQLSKKDGKPAAYKSIALAQKFLDAAGAQIEQPKKWTRPAAATIAPLEEQLANLPTDAPRFVVVEQPYATYHEQGYAVYDRKEQEIVSPHTYNGWNFVTQSREAAEKEAAYRQENPPVKIEMDMALWNMLPDVDNAPLYAPEPPAPAAPKEAVFVTEHKHTVGETITDKYGRRYRVEKESWYLSDRDAASLEDQDVFGAHVGWQTEAKLIEE